MENQKNNKGVIALLIVIIVILSALCILFATGTISLKSDTIQENNNQNETGNQEENDNINDNSLIDKELLNSLYDALGIPSVNNKYGNSQLSYLISRNDYKDYAKDIIVHSTVNSFGDVDGIELPEKYDRYKDTGACLNAIGCAIISEAKAHDIIGFYNFGGLLSEYFYKSSVLDNMYGIHFGGTLVMGEFHGPDAGITHKVNSEMINGTIILTDNQTILYYDIDNQNTLTTIRQTVTFEFNFGLDNYFLSSVSVK